MNEYCRVKYIDRRWHDDQKEADEESTEVFRQAISNEEDRLQEGIDAQVDRIVMVVKEYLID